MNSKPKSSPSKSIPESIPISKETQAILKRVTGLDYFFSHELPEKLDLSYCRDLVDVSALGGVKKLYLNGCIGVTDVSALGGVRVLYLSYCTGITDYSAVPHAKR